MVPTTYWWFWQIMVHKGQGGRRMQGWLERIKDKNKGFPKYSTKTWKTELERWKQEAWPPAALILYPIKFSRSAIESAGSEHENRLGGMAHGRQTIGLRGKSARKAVFCVVHFPHSNVGHDYCEHWMLEVMSNALRVARDQGVGKRASAASQKLQFTDSICRIF